MKQSNQFGLLVVDCEQLEGELLLDVLEAGVGLHIDFDSLIVKIRFLYCNFFDLIAIFASAFLLHRLNGVDATLVLRHDDLLVAAGFRRIRRGALLFL